MSDMSLSTPLRQAARRCTGHCCKKFFLPVTSAKELKLRYGGSRDVDYIADMIIKLPPQDTAADGKPIPEGEGRDHWFTCKHHDAVSGNCMAYDQRPLMCSDYPYGQLCKYKDCESSCNEELLKSRDGLFQKLGVKKPWSDGCSSIAITPKQKLTITDGEVVAALGELP